jgi:hypothetical protein
VDALFEGLEYIEPGLVQIPWWRPDRPLTTGDSKITIYGGIGYKS